MNSFEPKLQASEQQKFVKKKCLDPHPKCRERFNAVSRHSRVLVQHHQTQLLSLDVDVGDSPVSKRFAEVRIEGAFYRFRSHFGRLRANARDQPIVATKMRANFRFDECKKNCRMSVLRTLCDALDFKPFQGFGDYYVYTSSTLPLNIGMEKTGPTQNINSNCKDQNAPGRKYPCVSRHETVVTRTAGT